ncbi:hydroxysqualene dehydroxylase HpnE [Conchiformibius steedae]|uniref:hydroxysqualene dehydroxylase HpnE n=1 Tax=Conchiformibius steedae TaxID=153493 RepID=UPI0026F02C94|nr:hydroxysqualene dehydroxylase HpnE [Conchiformibius steedae]
MKQRYKVAVVGAGWAGLAAAVQLARQAEVVLFEAGREAGGRARTVASRHGFSFLDNGQHLLLGAYRSVFALLQQAGADVSAHTQRGAMDWQMHGGLRLQTAALPAPWHLLWGVWRARGWSWRQKTALLRQMAALQVYQRSCAPDQTVGAWLQGQGADATLQAQFWQPLVLAALNTPVASASLRVLANVLADGVWNSRDGSDFCLPKTDLGQWFVAPILRDLAAHGGHFVPSVRVEGLARENGRYHIHGQDFDAVVVAVAPHQVARVLPEAWFAPQQAWFESLKYHAITTVYLRFRDRVMLPAPMLGLADGTAHWLIDRYPLNGAHEIAAVVSVSEQYGDYTPAQWQESVCQDLRRACPNLPQPEACQVITEKRATVASEAGRTLPDLSAWRAQKLYVAGDYLHPRYPATLEAAVQSGMAAARQCVEDLI